MLVQAELGSRSVPVLDHAHPGSVLADLKGSGGGRNEAADVFEVGPADAPGTVNQEDQISHRRGGAPWEQTSRAQ